MAMSSHNASNNPIPDFLLAELHIWEEASWRNEEIGEKRFNFFVTLVTAVSGGIIVLWASDKAPDIVRVTPTLTWLATLALLVFGLLTYRRMIHRDIVTAEYRRASNYVRSFIRKTYREECPALREFLLPHEKDTQSSKHGAWTDRLRRISRGGYTPTLAFLNGLLLVPVLVFGAELTLPWAFSAGAVLAIALCWLGSGPHKNLESPETS
jgi:hypothetical protein